MNTSEKLIVLKFSNILKTIWLAWQSCFQRRGKVATLSDGYGCPDNFMAMAIILWHNLMAMMLRVGYGDGSGSADYICPVVYA